MRILLLLILSTLAFTGAEAEPPYILILGVTQDGGYPQAGCSGSCCAQAWKDQSLKRFGTSFALVDPEEKKWWLFEATPDFREQLKNFRDQTGSAYNYLPAGIFLTHAHIGHYAGLMQLGREVMNAHEVPVYGLPKLTDFLTANGPWSQLVSLKNIVLKPMKPGELQSLPSGIKVTAFAVPHRDEFSETAGFRISTPARSYLFIPDIDKWQKWELDIRKEVALVDVALLDATFMSAEELPGRDMTEIPHPLVSETMAMFSGSDITTRKKVFLIHFNHTNPLLWGKAEKAKIEQSGFNVTLQGMKL